MALPHAILTSGSCTSINQYMMCDVLIGFWYEPSWNWTTTKSSKESQINSNGSFINRSFLYAVHADLYNFYVDFVYTILNFFLVCKCNVTHWYTWDSVDLFPLHDRDTCLSIKNKNQNPAFVSHHNKTNHAYQMTHLLHFKVIYMSTFIPLWGRPVAFWGGV